MYAKNQSVSIHVWRPTSGNCMIIVCQFKEAVYYMFAEKELGHESKYARDSERSTISDR
jgi:hypothetical protein